MTKLIKTEVINHNSYTLFPLTKPEEHIIEVEESILKRIGIDKMFDLETMTVVDMDLEAVKGDIDFDYAVVEEEARLKAQGGESP